MRSILMSIRPQWCNLIFNGDETIELRKTRPNYMEILTPFKVFVYETMAILEEPWMDEDGHMNWRGSGRIVGEFVCNMIYQLEWDSYGIFDRYSVDPINLNVYEYLALFPDSSHASMSKTCVTKSDFVEYANGKQVYGWEIENPKRYKTPIDLSAFGIKRAPQSWCYVESEEER